MVMFKFNLKSALATLLIIGCVLGSVAAVEFEPKQVWQEPMNSTVSALALSPDGRALAVAGFDGTVFVFNRSNQIEHSFSLDNPVKALSLSTGAGRVLASTASKVVVYEKNVSLWTRDPGFVKDASLSANGRGIAYGVGRTVTYIDTAVEDEKKATHTFTTGSTVESVSSYATRKSRTWLVAAGDQNSVNLYGPAGSLWAYPIGDVVYDVAISPDGKFVASGTKGGRVYLFDSGGSLLWTDNLGEPVYFVQVSQEASFVVAAGRSKVVLIGGAEGGVLWGYQGTGIGGVGLSSTGSRLAVAEENRIVVFSVPSKDALLPLSIEIVSPLDGAAVSGLLELRVEKSKKAWLSVRIDGVEVTRPRGRGSYEFDTRLLSNGVHTITVDASDSYGNFDSKTVEVFIDNGDSIPPLVKLLLPEEGSILSSSVNVHALSNLPSDDISIEIDGVKVSDSLAFNWNTRAYSDGAHEIAVVARHLDEVYEDRRIVFVDNIPDRPSPSVTIFQPINGEAVSGIRAVRAAFSEEPAEVYVQVDGRIVSNALPYVWDVGSSGQKSSEIKVFAIDAEGDIGFDTVTVTPLEIDDPDGDGWNNEVEKLYRTDPNNPDTDGDGIIDSVDADPLRDYTELHKYLNYLLLALLVAAALIWERDLQTLLLLTFASAVTTAVPPYNTLPLRIPLGIFLVFFSTGYAFIAAMFPKKDISPLERFTLAIAFSIVIFVFNGFALNYTWGFRTLPIVVTVSAITLFFSIVAAIFRKITSKEKRFTFNYKLPKFTDEPMGPIEKTLIIALVLSIIIAGSMLVYAKLTFKHEQFTTLYILGPGGKAENYPKGFYLGEPQTITVGIENFERSPANYLLEVRLNGELQREEMFVLGDREKWINDLSFTPDQVGERLKLEFLLYKDYVAKPYRNVHLWVSSIPNYADPDSYKDWVFEKVSTVINGDFEAGALAWDTVSTNTNMTGVFSTDSYISPQTSFEMSLGSGLSAPSSSFVQISQEVFAEKSGLAILSFNVADSYRSTSQGSYQLQVLLNGKTLWERDVAGGSGWDQITTPVMLSKGENKLELTLTKTSEKNTPISVWWDDVKFESPRNLVVQ